MVWLTLGCPLIGIVLIPLHPPAYLLPHTARSLLDFFSNSLPPTHICAPHNPSPVTKPSSPPSQSPPRHYLLFVTLPLIPSSFGHSPILFSPSSPFNHHPPRLVAAASVIPVSRVASGTGVPASSGDLRPSSRGSRPQGGLPPSVPSSNGLFRRPLF